MISPENSPWLPPQTDFFKRVRDLDEEFQSMGAYMLMYKRYGVLKMGEIPNRIIIPKACFVAYTTPTLLYFMSENETLKDTTGEVQLVVSIKQELDGKFFIAYLTYSLSVEKIDSEPVLLLNIYNERMRDHGLPEIMNPKIGIILRIDNVKLSFSEDNKFVISIDAKKLFSEGIPMKSSSKFRDYINVSLLRQLTPAGASEAIWMF